MLRSSMALMVLCFLAYGISAQHKGSCGSTGKGIPTKDKPSIYLTFQGFDNVKLPSARLAIGETATPERKERESSERQVIWLRLHNNTPWAIGFPTESLYVGTAITPFQLCDGRPVLGLRTDVEVNARYELESVPNEDSAASLHALPSLNRSDMFSISWLPPDRSVKIFVLREHLSNKAIYLPYNYEWEYGERTFGPNEPTHRVYFRWTDLPKSMRK